MNDTCDCDWVIRRWYFYLMIKISGAVIANLQSLPALSRVLAEVVKSLCPDRISRCLLNGATNVNLVDLNAFSIEN